MRLSTFISTPKTQRAVSSPFHHPPKVGGLQYFLILILLSVAGCVRTRLDSIPIGDDHLRLANTGTRPITIFNQIPSEPVRAGNQWVFVFIPLGEITIEDPSKVVGNAVFKRLAERGYRPTVRSDHASRPPIDRPHTMITLSSAEFSCSVPDLLFIRIVRCHVSLNGYRGADSNVLISSDGYNAEYRAVGFKPQLNHSLESAISQALDELLNRMHL